MAEELGLANLPHGPKPLLRLAKENGLLAGSVEDWLAYAGRRAEMSHGYSAERAARCLEVVPGFVGGAIGLYEAMTGRRWE